jgi:SAM-dependent methyltransferase
MLGRKLLYYACSFVLACALFGVAQAMDDSKAAVSFDRRSTLSRSHARQVYDRLAEKGHTGGIDASSGYGGQVVEALVEIADFSSAKRVLDYGCGQGKLAEHILSSAELCGVGGIQWHGVDQSPLMVDKFRERCCANSRWPGGDCTVELLVNGDVANVAKMETVDRFVSTYCLDLLSEEDIYKVLDFAEEVLDPQDGRLLLVGITRGYRDSIKTAVMTLVWEFLYIVRREKVGGCRPQNLKPYLEAKGWQVVILLRTKPSGFPWMTSRVIYARHPKYQEP